MAAALDAASFVGERLVGGGLLGGGLLGCLLAPSCCSASALACSLAALRPAHAMSAMRSTVSSARWPFLTRERALGLYLNTTIFSPRIWRTTLALTVAPSTTGCADGGLVAVRHEQDARDIDALAGLDLQPVHLDLRAELDAVLLAAGFDDCVHGSLMSDGVTIAPRGTSNRR